MISFHARNSKLPCIISSSDLHFRPILQESKVNGHSEPTAVTTAATSSSSSNTGAKKSNQKEKNSSSTTGSISSSQTSSNQNGAYAAEAASAASSPAAARAATISVLPNGVVQSKDQLAYLAKVLGVTVTYQDFPKKNNKSEFFSLVSLSTDPPQVS